MGLSDWRLMEICLEQTNSQAIDKHGDAFLRIAQAVQREVLEAQLSKQDELPELPEPEVFLAGCNSPTAFSSDQMRDYGQLCRTTQPVQDDLTIAHEILSSICYNHDSNATFADLVSRVKGIADSWLNSGKSQKCKTCGGTGKCNDADLGDIYWNEWPCPDCKPTDAQPMSSKDDNINQQEN